MSEDIRNYQIESILDQIKEFYPAVQANGGRLAGGRVQIVVTWRGTIQGGAIKDLVETISNTTNRGVNVSIGDRWLRFNS